jgi:hypothetical protein
MGTTPVETFEQWVYTTPELESVLRQDDYLNLIALDFSRQSSQYEATKVLRRYIQAGEYETWKLKTLLLALINQEQDPRHLLYTFYELYCNGYSFLDGLGLGYGLALVVPPGAYRADSWDELNKEDQQRLLHSLLPEAIAEARTVLNWLDDGSIVITNEQDEFGQYMYGEFGNYVYLDRRGEN